MLAGMDTDARRICSDSPYVSCLETSIVIESRYGADGLHALDRFIMRAGIEQIPVDPEQGEWRVRPLVASARDVIVQG